MKAETLSVISDARGHLRKIALNDARQNPLLAAFLGWLFREGEFLQLLAEAAEAAAAAKGAVRNSRNVAVLGFASEVGSLRDRFIVEFESQLDWSVGRPNFTTGGEPTGMVADAFTFAGAVAGASQLQAQTSQKFKTWAQAVWNDAVGIAQDGWRRVLLEIVGKHLDVAAARNSAVEDPVWLNAALQRRGWTVPEERSVASVIKTTVEGVISVTDGFEAGMRLAALDWAIARAMDCDISALTLGDVIAVLQRVPNSFQRWTWEDKPRTAKAGAEARRWHIENEYHFQSLLYVILKPIIPALEEEQYLPPTGTYQPRADLCILALEVVIEVKFWYKGKSAKDLIEEIAADLTLYLRQDSPYKRVIAAIWDDGARTEAQGELRRGLKGLTGLAEVVIVNRPSCMSAPPIQGKYTKA